VEEIGNLQLLYRRHAGAAKVNATHRAKYAIKQEIEPQADV
jgi:hypothetical protein